MKPTAKEMKDILNRAVVAVRADEPSPETIAAARARAEARLFAPKEALSAQAVIRGCDDVQSLLTLYRRAGLSAPRALLVRNHLAECVSCREVWTRRGTMRVAHAPWQGTAAVGLQAHWHARRGYAVLAAALVFAVAVVVLRSLYVVPAIGQPATVQAVNGALYRIDGSRADRLVPGATLTEGQVVRAGSEPQSLLRLADDSLVELGERAEFSISMRGKDTTLKLNRGQVIVKAAKRRAGHLIVTTRDCRVAVTGTVFSVMASLKGSRVSVIEGEVHVDQSGKDQLLHRGDQVTTSPGLARIPIEKEVAWSRNLDEHLALLREMTELRKKWDEVRLPELRYESQLLDLVPENTLVFAALPNYGQALHEGYRLLKDTLTESEVLRRWWDKSDLSKNGERLDAGMTKAHALASALGNEAVIVVSRDEFGEHSTVLAEVTKPGLGELVRTELGGISQGERPLTVVTEQEFAAGALSTLGLQTPTLLITPRLVALSSSSRVISDLVARISKGAASGFRGSALGMRAAQMYAEGAGVLVLADLESLLMGAAISAENPGETGTSPSRLEFERKEVQGEMLSRGVLAFPGPRQGIASWLAKPAPMGSLEFFTPQASAVAAFVAKRPAEVLDDILRLNPGTKDLRQSLTEMETELNLRIREDVAEALGSEVAIALDGPLLPQPAWKLVVEVEDAERLERAIEAMVRRADQELLAKREGSLLFLHEQVGRFVYHRIIARATKFPMEIDYAFIDGYVVVTPSRPLLSRAIEARQRGESLGRSQRFTSLLPRDGRPSFSGLFFQDLVSVLAMTLDTTEFALSASQQQTLEKLLGQSKPSLVGFYAEDDHVDMASVGDLFGLGPEALALPALVRRTFPINLDETKP